MADITKKGLFITFEGGEGSGKTTQSNLLNAHLQKKGYTTLLLREPGGTLIGEKIREILLNKENTALSPIAELFLYEAARSQIIAEKIKPNLDQGVVVLCDRYIDSTVAYQGYGRGINLKWIDELNEIAAQGLLPDMTLFLDIDPSVGLERAMVRHAHHDISDTRFEAEALYFHQKVREGFLALKEKYPNRFRVIDASLPSDQVHLAIVREIQPILRPPAGQTAVEFPDEGD